MEPAPSFILVLVILAAWINRRLSSRVMGLAIRLTVVHRVLVRGPVTGGSMNPALFSGGAALSSLPLYLVVPPLGAVLAALSYEGLRLHPEHASGAPNELLNALTEIGSAETPDPANGSSRV